MHLIHEWVENVQFLHSNLGVRLIQECVLYTRRYGSCIVWKLPFHWQANCAFDASLVAAYTSSVSFCWGLFSVGHGCYVPHAWSWTDIYWKQMANLKRWHSKQVNFCDTSHLQSATIVRSKWYVNLLAIRVPIQQTRIGKRQQLPFLPVSLAKKYEDVSVESGSVQSSHSNFPKKKSKKSTFWRKKKHFLWGFLSYILVWNQVLFQWLFPDYG